MWKNMSVWEVSYYCIFVLFFFLMLFCICIYHISLWLRVLLRFFWYAHGPVQDHTETVTCIISGIVIYSIISWEPWWICGNKLCPTIGSLGIALPCQNRAAFIFRGRSAAYSWIFVPQSTLWCRHKCMQSRIMLCTFS